jgi:hypothetical protein
MLLMTTPDRMTAFDYSALNAELDSWSAAGLTATFWWRDDDAVGLSPQLERLLGVANGRPLALAVVPFHASAALADRLRFERHVTIFQHGWKHENHSLSGPSSEYPPGRAAETVAQEFLQGSEKLARMFGDQFVPVFTPPWHGLDSSYIPLLKPAGIRGLSSKGRRSAASTNGVVQNNIHCVPIQWSDPPGFADPARYIAQLVGHLKQRRSSNDRAEATGILTHHLVQTDESLEFVRGILDVVTEHPNAVLVDPAELFLSLHEGLSSVDRATA